MIFVRQLRDGVPDYVGVWRIERTKIMKNEMIINIGSFEDRLAILEDNQLVELLIHEQNKKEIIGNIYKGIVKDNVPGMGATFIDIGLDRTALLHFRDAIPDFLDLEELEDENSNFRVRLSQMQAN